MTTEQKIKEIDQEIELLQKEKQKALLQQEIEKIKKTKIVEEEIIIQKIPIYKIQTCPQPPHWYNVIC